MKSLCLPSSTFPLSEDSQCFQSCVSLCVCPCLCVSFLSWSYINRSQLPHPDLFVYTIDSILGTCFASCFFSVFLFSCFFPHFEGYYIMVHKRTSSFFCFLIIICIPSCDCHIIYLADPWADIRFSPFSEGGLLEGERIRHLILPDSTELPSSGGSSLPSAWSACRCASLHTGSIRSWTVSHCSVCVHEIFSVVKVANSCS